MTSGSEPDRVESFDFEEPYNGRVKSAPPSIVPPQSPGPGDCTHALGLLLSNRFDP